MACSDAGQIELKEESFSIDAGEADMDGIADARALAVDDDITKVFHEPFGKLVA